MRKKPCGDRQINRAVPDFHCNLMGGHGGPHLDPATRTPWNHREIPKGRASHTYHINKKVTRRNG